LAVSSKPGVESWIDAPESSCRIRSAGIQREVAQAKLDRRARDSGRRCPRAIPGSANSPPGDRPGRRRPSLCRGNGPQSARHRSATPHHEGPDPVPS